MNTPRMNQRIFRIGTSACLPLMAAAVLGSQASIPVVADSALPGATIFTHPAGQAGNDPIGSLIESGGTNQSYSQPEMELRQGSMEVVSGTLKVFIMVSNLQHISSAVPGTPGDGRSHVWQVVFDAHQTLYHVEAVDGYDPATQAAGVRYADSSHSGVCEGIDNLDGGSFTTGPSGVIEIDVPLSHLGATGGRLDSLAVWAYDAYGYYGDDGSAASPAECSAHMLYVDQAHDLDFDMSTGQAVDPGPGGRSAQASASKANASESHPVSAPQSPAQSQAAAHQPELAPTAREFGWIRYRPV